MLILMQSVTAMVRSKIFRFTIQTRRLCRQEYKLTSVNSRFRNEINEIKEKGHGWFRRNGTIDTLPPGHREDNAASSDLGSACRLARARHATAHVRGSTRLRHTKNQQAVFTSRKSCHAKIHSCACFHRRLLLIISEFDMEQLARFVDSHCRMQR